ETQVRVACACAGAMAAPAANNAPSSHDSRVAFRGAGIVTTTSPMSVFGRQVLVLSLGTLSRNLRVAGTNRIRLFSVSRHRRVLNAQKPPAGPEGPAVCFVEVTGPVTGASQDQLSSTGTTPCPECCPSP